MHGTAARQPDNICNRPHPLRRQCCDLPVDDGNQFPEWLATYPFRPGTVTGIPAEVVALHRAAMRVDNVQFQGKTTAYVNVGTHIRLIMDDIAQRYPALAAEIASCKPAGLDILY